MLDEFFADIKKAKNALGFKSEEECFYRGQSNNTWPLLPSLMRHCHANGLQDKDVRKLEHNLFYEFQARARELHQWPLSGWDTLFFMRHYGVATRILDWTEVLGVALYFALHSVDRAATPCVWLLNPYALNVHPDSWKTRDLVAPQFLQDSRGQVRDYESFLVGEYPRFGWEHPVALYPLQRSDRLHAQRGYFTIHGQDLRPLEDINPAVIKKVDIGSPQLRKEIEDFLEVSGINTHLLFPGLDGLSRYLHEKYGIGQSPQVSIYGI
jgi:hypothetical protein